MHFEVSDELIREWAGQGLFGAAPPHVLRILTIGDRGPEVRALQTRLNEQGATLRPDGIFGPSTRAALTAFQAAHGLPPDGVVGPDTSRALGFA